MHTPEDFMGFHLSNKFFVSSTTLLARISSLHTFVVQTRFQIVEWLATLGEEIKYVWESPRVYAKILFILVRYPVFAVRALDAYLRTPHLIPVSWCARLCIAMNSLNIFVLFFAELTMTIRVGVLWRRNLYVKALICFMTIANVTVATVMVFLPKSPTLPTTSGLSPQPIACFFVNHTTLIMPYIILIFHETFIFILTAIKGVEHYKSGIRGSSLIKTLYYDGIIYYALAIVPSFAFIMMAFLKVNGTQVFIASDIQPVVLSILSSRLSLHLRYQAADQEESMTVHFPDSESSGHRSCP